MTYFAQKFTPPVRGLIVTPLAVGSRWRVLAHVDAAATVQLLHARFQAIDDKKVSVLCPEMPPGGGEDSVRIRPEVLATFTSVPRPRVAVCTMGRRQYVKSKYYPLQGPDEQTSAYVQIIALEMFYRNVVFPKLKGKAKLTESELSLFYEPLPDTIYEEADAFLRKHQIIGDICRYGITESGRIARTKYDSGFLAIDPEKQLRAWRNEEAPTETILVLGGHELAAVAKAALRGGYFSTVIFDTSLGLALLDRRDWPEAYKSLPIPTKPKSAKPNVKSTRKSVRA
jgi:hypothetical protein